MFILIFGKDTYRAWQKLKDMVAAFKKKIKISFLLGLVDSQRLTFQDFKDELRHGSMFEKEKLVVLRDAFLSSEFKDSFLKEAKSFADDKTLLAIFFEEKDIGLTSDLLNFFKKYGKVYKYDALAPVALKEWVKKEMADLGKEIEGPALALLIKSVGNDLWWMAAEIKKLAAYKGKAKLVEKKDVELLVKPGIETAIFKTIDAIAEKDKKTALPLLYEHLEKGDSPLYLLSMINYQFRNLLLVKNLEGRPFSELTTALKPMQPFVVQKSLGMAKKFSLEQLEAIYLKLFKMDLAVKTGKIKPELALELLIADI